VVIPDRWVDILQDHFGRHADVRGPAGKGTTRVTVTAPTPRDIARNLAGWGSMIDVETPSVRAELARIGSELVDRFR
jgi:hypothetical protein